MTGGSFSWGSTASTCSSLASREFIRPVARLQVDLVQFCLARAGGGAVVIEETHHRRQRHQDRLGAPARLEAEQCTAVVDEVELDVAAAAELLEGALLPREQLAFAALGDRQVRFQEVVAAVADE